MDVVSAVEAALALPEPLRQYAGRIMDVDSHEMIPVQDWLTTYGPEVKPMMDAWLAKEETDANDKNSPNVPGYPGDIVEIGADVTSLKGARSPGASLQERRLEVMDTMGVKRQLVFSSYVGIFSLIMAMNPRDTEFLRDIKEGRHELALKLLGIYNDWAIKTSKISDRLRPVCPIYAETPQELIESAKYLIDNGIRAIQLPAGNLPGGVSPAHPDLDPFWSMLCEANCTVVLHIGCEGQFFETRDWGKAPVFEGFRNLGEFNVDPWSLSILHLPFQNFMNTMVVGGVFARHPALRLGIMEVGAHWVGATMEALDTWYRNSQAFKTENNYRLPELPSYYIRKNVRVAPYVFEPVDEYIEQYGLEDVLVFSTDYPHVEGGRDMFRIFLKRVERLGPEIMEKFFVTNGSLLLPD